MGRRNRLRSPRGVPFFEEDTMRKVFRFRMYDITRDDYVTSTRMATKKKIKEIGGEIVPDSEAKIDDASLTDGLTARYFEPKKV
jgi:hypothetical protein